jgi:hypothetical protein
LLSHSVPLGVFVAMPMKAAINNISIQVSILLMVIMVFIIENPHLVLRLQKLPDSTVDQKRLCFYI